MLIIMAGNVPHECPSSLCNVWSAVSPEGRQNKMTGWVRRATVQTKLQRPQGSVQHDPRLCCLHSDLSSMSQMWPLLVSPHTKYAIKRRRQFIRFWSHHRKTTRIKYASFGLVNIIAHKRTCITKHPWVNISSVTRSSLYSQPHLSFNTKVY